MPYLISISVPRHYPVELIAKALREGLDVTCPLPETIAKARAFVKDPAKPDR